MQDREYSLSISQLAFASKPDLDGAGWARLNDSFRTYTLPPTSIMNAVYKGHSIAPVMKGRRDTKNFVQAQHIGIDLDEGDPQHDLGRLLKHPLIMAHGAIVYRTFSHKPEAPRSRVIFLLDEPITVASSYRMAIDAMTVMFGKADPKSVDAARFFYGNGSLQENEDTDGIRFSDSFSLSHQTLRQYIRSLQILRKQAAPAEERRAEPAGQDLPFDPDRVVQGAIRNAVVGNRNSGGYYIACKLQENGVTMGDAIEAVRRYQSAVETLSGSTEAYTLKEAINSVKSAYKG